MSLFNNLFKKKGFFTSNEREKKELQLELGMERHSQEAKLKVAKALLADASEQIIRIGKKELALIGAKPGDVLEIEGTRKTAGFAAQLPLDEKFIRINEVMRHNAGVSIGGSVKVRKADASRALAIYLSPASKMLFHEEFVEKMHCVLTGTLAMKGNSIIISISGDEFAFIIDDTIPGGIVKIGEETKVSIRRGRAARPSTHPAYPSYEDIGGLEHAIKIMREMIELPLRQPGKLAELGAEVPKGALLFGPSGCGKTLLAKAVANESESHFIGVSSTDILGKEAVARLKAIFDEAREFEHSIIFIDEIDAIGARRAKASKEIFPAVSQLLSAMDGFVERGKVVVIGATNRPDALDSALLRPGRFDRKIYIPLPNEQARAQIFAIHARHLELAEGIDFPALAKQTAGFSGADIAAVCREAGMLAAGKHSKKISMEHFTTALAKIKPSIGEGELKYWKHISTSLSAKK